MNKSKIFMLPEKNPIRFGDVYFIKDKVGDLSHPYLVISKINSYNCLVVGMSTSFADGIPIMGKDYVGNYMVSFADPSYSAYFQVEVLRKSTYGYTLNENVTELIQKACLSSATNIDCAEEVSAYIAEFAKRYSDMMPEKRPMDSVNAKKRIAYEESLVGIIPENLKLIKTPHGEYVAPAVVNEEKKKIAEKHIKEITSKRKYNRAPDNINELADAVITGGYTAYEASQRAGISVSSMNRYVAKRKADLISGKVLIPEVKKEDDTEYLTKIKEILANPLTISDEFKSISNLNDRVNMALNDGIYHYQTDGLPKINTNIKKNTNKAIYVYMYTYQKYGVNATAGIYKIKRSAAPELYNSMKILMEKSTSNI